MFVSASVGQALDFVARLAAVVLVVSVHGGVFVSGQTSTTRNNEAEWGEWGRFSGCSQTCGVGTRSRMRSCKTGICRTGKTTETRRCTVQHCEPARTSQWSEWTPCSATCGGGTASRKRCRTSACNDYDRMSKPCTRGQCPQRESTTDWSSWSRWSSCTVDCVKTRRRTCDAGLNQCSGSAETNARCLELPCTNSWTNWSTWTPCSVTCGSGGQQQRTRNCPRGANPRCQGDDRQQQACSAGTPCRDARWGVWSRWSACSETCDNGLRTRIRACTGTIGRCDGNTVEEEDCRIRVCGPPPSAGNDRWDRWRSWSSCSQTCGGGYRTRTRSCSRGGCTGDRSESSSCNTSPCPAVASSWTQWSDWGGCSVTCGRGRSSRRRSCSTASGCPGSRDEYKSCVPRPCESGRWQEWGLWSACSQSCGTGNSYRARVCAQGVCSGHSREVEDCTQMSCDGAMWAAWSRWSPCSISCGVGNAIRQRACLGEFCHGTLREVKSCAVAACPGVPLPPTTATAGAITESIKDVDRLAVGNGGVEVVTDPDGGGAVGAEVVSTRKRSGAKATASFSGALLVGLLSAVCIALYS